MTINATLVPDARVAERRQTELRATARTADGRPDDVTVFDVSLSGFRISAVPDLAVGSQLTLGLSGVGTRRATVIRQAGDAMGCAFDEPLSYAELRDALTGDTVVQVNFAQPDADPGASADDAADEARPWSVLPIVLVAAATWALAGLFVLAVALGLV